MQLPEDAVRELTSLTGVVLAQQDLPSSLREMTRIAVRAVPAGEGASITEIRTEGPVVAATSDEWAQQLDELQFTEREGPCLDCTRTGNAFRVRDLAGETRWPSWAPRAVALGARSVMSLPLAADGRLVGALNVYSRTPDAYDAQAVAVAEVIAAHCGLATQVASAFFGHRDLAGQLRDAMTSRAVIEQAKGILMAQHRVTADQAFGLLRTASQRRNVKLRELAEELVRTGELRATGADG